MSTRSLTIFIDQGEELAVLYRHADGYPEGHGADLKDAFGACQIVKGLTGAETRKIANGMDCLAAQVVAHFKKAAGNAYLMRAGTRDVGEEFIYTLYCPGETGTLRLKVQGGAITYFGLPGTKQENMPVLLKDLSWMLTETVSQLPAKFAAQGKTFDAYQRTELSDRQVHDIIVRLFDEGALNLMDIPKLIKEWREPRHPEFAQGKTAWRLFNAATETLKGDLWRLPVRTQRVHAILDAECGLADTSQPQPERTHEHEQSTAA